MEKLKARAEIQRGGGPERKPRSEMIWPDDVTSAAMAHGVGAESVEFALAALEEPSDRRFEDALGLLAIARLTMSEMEYACIEGVLLQQLLSSTVAPKRRERIAEAFATLLGRVGLNARLLPQLSSTSAQTRLVAAIALGSGGNLEAFGPLCAALEDGDAEVAVAAACSLAAIGHQKTEAVFAQTLRNYPARALRLAILSRLRAEHSTGAERTAIEHLDDDDPEVRLAAALALSPPISAEAHRAARRLAQDPDGRVRVLAIALIEQGPESEALFALQPLLTDPVPRVRRVAADAAKRIIGERQPIRKLKP